MNHNYVLFAVFITLFAESSCNTGAKNAKQYHDNMVQKAQAVIDSSLDYVDAIQSYDKVRALQLHGRYSSLVENAIAAVGEQGDYKGDTVLRAFTLEMLGFYKTTLNNEFGPFLNSIKAATFSEAEIAISDSLITKMTGSENQYWERFNWAEKKFYKEHEVSKAEK